LINKIKAYSLQDIGLDTVEANERLGFAPDLRDYGMGAQMLNDLGVRQIRLITNNPRKIAGLKGYGIEIVDRVPLIIEATDYNTVYLATKAQKLGHLLLQTYLITIAITWDEPQSLSLNLEEESLERKRNPTSVPSRYERLEKLRFLAQTNDLLLQEEARPVAIALFDQAPLIVNLGFDQAGVADPHWYQQLDHPYLKAITEILEQITQWPHLQTLQFMVSSGVDPLTNLQVKLKREQFLLTQKPALICQQLHTQTIYSFSHQFNQQEVQNR
jgi:3,4-dihydroxy 2-butanone 4-phosphate synthase/GTP cyclohydrolase II